MEDSIMKILRVQIHRQDFDISTTLEFSTRTRRQKMKSMIAFALLAIIVAVNADPVKVCFQAPDTCSELKDASKAYFRGAIADRSGDIEIDAPKALAHLRDLFSLGAKYEDCKVESCICNAGKLECSPVADKIRAGLARIQPPTCLGESEKAAARMISLTQAVSDGKRQEISDNLGQLHDDLVAAIDAKDEAVISCMKETVFALRKALKDKIKELDIQKTCDFCQA